MLAFLWKAAALRALRRLADLHTHHIHLHNRLGDDATENLIIFCARCYQLADSAQYNYKPYDGFKPQQEPKITLHSELGTTTWQIMPDPEQTVALLGRPRAKSR